MSKEYTVYPQESWNDRVIRLLNAGESRDFVFADIVHHAPGSIDSKKKLQNLADVIAQLDSMNVFATGTVPKNLNDLLAVRKMNSQALKSLEKLVAERKVHTDASKELDNSYGVSFHSRSELIKRRDELEDHITFMNAQIADFVCDHLSANKNDWSFN